MNYLEIVEVVKDILESNPLIDRVQNEDLDALDIDKDSIYPLAGFYISNINLGSSTNTFTINLLVMDILDVNKEADQDNKDFIWNQSLGVINNLITRLRRGDLFEGRLQVEDEVIAEPFTDRFDKGLAGMGVTISLIVPNEMTIC